MFTLAHLTAHCFVYLSRHLKRKVLKRSRHSLVWVRGGEQGGRPWAEGAARAGVWWQRSLFRGTTASLCGWNLAGLHSEGSGRPLKGLKQSDVMPGNEGRDGFVAVNKVHRFTPWPRRPSSLFLSPSHHRCSGTLPPVQGHCVRVFMGCVSVGCVVCVCVVYGVR